MFQTTAYYVFTQPRPEADLDPLTLSRFKQIYFLNLAIRAMNPDERSASLFNRWIDTVSAIDVLENGVCPAGPYTGHHSLLVKLQEMAYVLLSGDLAHFHENYVGG